MKRRGDFKVMKTSSALVVEPGAAPKSTARLCPRPNSPLPSFLGGCGRAFPRALPPTVYWAVVSRRSLWRRSFLRRWATMSRKGVAK